jgi:hypothetical protein
MANVSLLNKLRLKVGQRILLLNPPLNFLEVLGNLPAGMHLDSTPEGEYDAVLLFVKDSLELGEFKTAILNAIRYDGLLWISYPKGSSKVKTDLNRDILWEKMADTNWRPVTLVSVDETWSAMRFRPTEVVGK